MSQYNFSLTTFSPSGRLGQIDYALTAANQGATSLGIKASNGVVIATEKKPPSSLVDDDSIEKVAQICPNIGMVYSGMGPDYRVIVAKARKAAQAYRKVYGEYPPVRMLVQDVATIMQDATQSGGVRPFGVSLLIAGHDTARGASLYQVDPSGSYWAWKASATGKNMTNAKQFLEKRYNADLSLEDAIHTAILTLKEGFEGQMTESTIEIGVVHVTPPAPKGTPVTSTTSTQGDPIDKTAMEVEAHLRRSAETEEYMPTMFRGPPVTFRKLTMTEVKDYLEQL